MGARGAEHSKDGDRDEEPSLAGLMAAPDYAAPIVGWRGWFVVEAEGTFRLCLLVHHTYWPPRRELVAGCRSTEHRSKPEPTAEHAPPVAACRCAIYACQSAAAATSFLSGSRAPRQQALGLVLGRVSLWGKLVECQHGWRGERAYPASIYVPKLGADGRLPPVRSSRPESVALALGSYGVPVEPVAFESVAELARELGNEHGQA